MKIKNGPFKQCILVGLIALTSTSQSFGQVITRVLSPEDEIENYIPWYNSDEEIPIINAPFVDVEAVLQADQQTGREMPRIGIKQEVNYTMEDGQLIERENYSLWSLTLRSVNAKSMSVRFDGSNLPEDAVMFLFNKESRFIVGPIKNSNFRNGTFRSDYLNGDRVNISLFIPGIEASEIVSVNLTSFDHGIISFRVFDDDFEDSEPCNVNVTCEQGVGWECQSESVCKIIHSSIGSCTGSLVNNDCCDLTPFVLTADHCIADFPVDDYLYRFNYQSPQCEPNGETSPSQWITYYGSDITAGWVGTDFGLVELFDRPTSGMSFAGWDRTNQTPPNSTFIHHPSGDVTKVTFDSGVSTPAGNFYDFNLTPGVNGDFGTLEGGSSGCPKYNPDQRIIGQQSGGVPQTILCTTTNSANEDGRFDISWEGNGTPDSRLRDWLGASTNPNTMDCMEHPFVEGPGTLCSGPETYALINNMPCTKSITWRVEPTNLFTSPVSGTGDIAVITGSLINSGSATLIYTLSAEGCNDAEVEYDLFVGRPCTFELHSFPTEICIGEQGETFLNLFEDCLGNYSSIEWDFYGAISGYGYDNKGRYTGITTGYGYVCVTVTNDCGSKEVCDRILVKDCGGGFGFRNSRSNPDVAELEANISPNPANDFVEVVCSGYVSGARITASLISADGKLVETIEEYSHSFKVDMAELPSGLYILQLNVEGMVLYEKIVKL